MFQASYISADVPFRTLKSMSNAIMKQVLPETKPHMVSLHEAMDGDQVLDFYWVDPIDAAKRFISKPKFAGSQSLPGNSTQSTSGRTLCADQESEPLAGPIQGWFFNLHN